jgi:hypothetical protein
MMKLSEQIMPFVTKSLIEEWAEEVARLEAENDDLKQVVSSIEGHEFQHLLKHAEILKQSDGEGWAIGEMTERAVAFLEAALTRGVTATADVTQIPGETP